MSKLRIALTTGDVDGIGLEVTAKALHHLGPQKNVQFFLFRSPSVASRELRLIDQKFQRVTVSSFAEALNVRTSPLVDVVSDLSPAHWVETAGKACLTGDLQAMATAPLSKTSIKNAGFQDLGHTDILKRISKSKSVHMGFIGQNFNVVLATAHIPHKNVSDNLTKRRLKEALMNANALREMLPGSQKKLPIGILGLNPHAGEKGLIGQEELQLFPDLLSFAKANKIPVEGPLVPDAAFFPENWRRFSVYLALYHDQGLIPFKMIHGQDSGVHISLGVPLIRTSVDHGTAKDIFGKNKANPHSMIDAIRWAIKLARLKST